MIASGSSIAGRRPETLSITDARIDITLDAEHATKLARLAVRAHVNAGTLARSLLSSGIDDADPDADTVVAVLEAINGAWDCAQLGRHQADSRDTINVEQLQHVVSRRDLPCCAARPRSGL